MRLLIYFGWMAAIVISLTGFFYPIHQDEQVFLQISQQIHSGDILYQQAVDNKPPGIYLVWYLVLKLSNSSFISDTFYLMRFITLISNWITAYFIYLIAGQGRLTALSYLIILPFYQGQFAITEPFMIMWLVIGMYFTLSSVGVEATESQDISLNLRNVLPSTALRADQLKIFLAGICLGLAALFKQPAIINIIAVYIYILGSQITKIKLQITSKPKIKIIKFTSLAFQIINSKFIYNFLFSYLLFTIGVILVWLPALGYFYLNSTLQNFWQAVVIFNFLEYPPMWMDTFQQLPQLIWPVIAIIGITSISRARTYNSCILVILFIILPLPFILTRPYHHYWLQVLPFIIIRNSRILDV
jgi:hypothetical protein